MWCFPLSTTLLLIRHASAGKQGIFCGHLDPPLTEEGRRQAANLAASLAAYPAVALYSSDLLRARETADCLAAQWRIAVREEASLREIAFGVWEGKSWDDIEREDLRYAQEWLRQFPMLSTPGGEGFQEFCAHIRLTLEEIVEEIAGQAAAIVAHAGVIRVALREMAEWTDTEAWAYPLPYCCRVELSCQDGRWSVIDGRQAGFT